MRHRSRSVDAATLAVLDAPSDMSVSWTPGARRGLGLSSGSVSEQLAALPDRHDLMSALSAAQRDGPVGLLVVDLDDFKRVNDTQGHAAGDELLVQVAHRLVDHVRSDATVTRFGADEFVVVLPGTRQGEVDDIVDGLHDCIRQPFHIGGREVVMSASIGATSDVARAGLDPSVLLQEADTAVAEAKRLGRGRTAAFTSDLRRRLVERVEMEADLREALEQHLLHLHYQPQIDLVTGRVVGVEALARWTRPDGRSVPPDQFIGVAEESGLIHELGRWVIDTACAQLAEWERRTHSSPQVMSINVSPAQLSDPFLVESVERAVVEHGIEASALCIELTETGFARFDEHVEVLQGLRDLGCFLAIDDFGTGYSSLGRLRDLPVEVLKIDRSFVNGLGLDPDDSAIVAAILNLATALGLHVVAEGIERVDQADALAEMGCPVGQGYLFARPADPIAVGHVLGRRLWRPRRPTTGDHPLRRLTDAVPHREWGTVAI